MQAMLTAAQRPVLSDVTLTLPGVKGCELYPYPLPDLFCGMPLVIAGKYDGSWPANGITVNGTLPNGARELGRGEGLGGSTLFVRVVVFVACGVGVLVH